MQGNQNENSSKDSQILGRKKTKTQTLEFLSCLAELADPFKTFNFALKCKNHITLGFE